MEKRHLDRLNERADEFAAVGRTTFSRWELLTWFGQERITKNIWRSLEDHIRSAAETAKPYVMEVGPDYLVFDRERAKALATLI